MNYIGQLRVYYNNIRDLKDEKRRKIITNDPILRSVEECDELIYHYTKLFWKTFLLLGKR